MLHTARLCVAAECARWASNRVFDARGEEQGIGGFLALGGTPGPIIGKREPAMGLRGIPETEIIFENLEIPEDMPVLPPRGLRHGLADLKTLLSLVDLVVFSPDFDRGRRMSASSPTA